MVVLFAAATLRETAIAKIPNSVIARTKDVAIHDSWIAAKLTLLAMTTKDTIPISKLGAAPWNS